MKKILLVFVLFALVKANRIAQLPDLPSGGATTFNVQTLPAGSYVIGMDNTTQPGSGTIMNLRAYGLLVTLLDNSKRLRWVIKPGKALDATDFSANAQKMVTTATPTTVTKQTDAVNGSNILVVNNNTGIVVGMVVSGDTHIPANSTVTAISGLNITISSAATGNLNNKNISFTSTAIGVTFNAAANYDFKAGPFVIFQSDTAGVSALVGIFNAAGTPVNVYKTTANVSVDIRYDYLLNGVIWKPKAAILNDGGNAAIHEGYMNNADVPTTNWTEETTPGFVTNCYTFASEPHNTSAPNNVIQGIRDFVSGGGNFLAECAAVRTYELSTLARFQSTNGFDNANENGDPSTWAYSNTDLGYFQINGYFGIADEGGSLKDWVIPQAPGNPPVNNFHYYTSGAKSGRNYTNASASKLFPANVAGGMVFYLGSHSYDGTHDYDINGQRMYLNAFITPTNPQGSLQTAAVPHCSNPMTVNVGSAAGPTAAYPLTFTLYRDLPPAGYNVGDQQLGNVVTMTAPNTYQGGVSVITSPPLAVGSTYLVAIRPASGCFQPKYLSFPCDVLSVSLMTFTATRNSSLVNLKWTTSSEQNCKGFNIERMLGNGSWETVGFINSKAVNGSSSAELNYTYVDINNFKGISQYRLQQVDYAGESKASEIRSVPGEDQKASNVTVFPNPSDGIVNVVFENNSTAIRDVSLSDMSGRAVKQWRGITTNSIQIDNLASGMYSLRVVNRETGEQTVEKIVINKR